ncbi:MAG: RNA polymerase sigma factor [Planctomycetota bacterium]
MFRFLRQPDASDGVSPPEERPDDRPGDADIPLVQAAQNGDQDAFGRLIRRHQKKAVAVSYRLLGNREDALEVTQDAFLKAFKSLDSLERPGAFGGWLMRIVSNLSLNYRRGRALRQTADLDDVGFGITHGRSADGETTGKSPDPVRAAQGKELGDRLQAALNELPEKQRAALVLFTLEGLPQKEVAEQLDCSVEAVKWHVFQARKKLKGMLEDLL